MTDIVDELRERTSHRRADLLDDAAERISVLRITIIRQRERIEDMERLIDRMRRQLRQAQRMACTAAAQGNDSEARRLATVHGWDCFANAEGAQEVQP